MRLALAPSLLSAVQGRIVNFENEPKILLLGKAKALSFLLHYCIHDIHFIAGVLYILEYYVSISSGLSGGRGTRVGSIQAWS
jgi:hypothetical protein